MSKVKVLVFSGSIRKAPFNKKLAAVAAQSAETKADVTLLDLADFPLPLYDGDLEASDGLPTNVKKLRRMFDEHDAFIIASPEYNGFFSPLLKNTIDWISRSDAEEPDLAPYKRKVAALLAASPGGLGGLRALPGLRQLLSGIGVLVVPSQLAVGGAMNVFDEDGQLKDESWQPKIDSVVEDLVRTTAALKA